LKIKSPKIIIEKKKKKIKIKIKIPREKFSPLSNPTRAQDH